MSAEDWPPELAELHDRLAPELVNRVVKETIAAGGGIEQVLVTTESVVMGVVLACVRLGGDDKVLDVMIDGVRQRLAQKRLGDLPTQGRG